jgi:hypothetical protein
VSGRQLCNLIYVHLRNRQEHAEKCTTERCTPSCGFVQFDQWLDSPVTAFDRRDDERRKDRLAGLLRGEVPA